MAGAGELCCQGSGPRGDVGKDGDDLHVPRENAAVVDIVGAEEIVDVVVNSTSVRANARFEPEGFTFTSAKGKERSILFHFPSDLIDLAADDIDLVINEYKAISVLEIIFPLKLNHILLQKILKPPDEDK